MPVEPPPRPPTAEGIAGHPAPDVLTVRVEGKGEFVALASLIDILRETLGILRDVDECISPSRRRTLRWEVTDASLNSPLTLTITGRPSVEDYSEGVVATYLEGMGRLERVADQPEYFSEGAVKKARSIAATRNDGVASVIYSGPVGPPVEPTQHLAANVDQILKQGYRLEVTSLSGVLKTIDTHRGLKFRIYDVLTGQRTSCHFPESLLGEAAAAIRRRVLVTGTVRYSRRAEPLSMKATSLYRFPDAADLPAFRAGHGVDITRGIESGAFVRRGRDAD